MPRVSHQFVLPVFILFVIFTTPVRGLQVTKNSSISLPIKANLALSLYQVLNTDGTLALKSGLEGTFDARGYTMSYNSSGSPVFAVIAGDDNWSQFNMGGGKSYVTSIAISGNDVYVGGGFSMAGGVAARNIAKWNGSTWSALGDGVNSIVRAIAVSGSDVYAGGEFTIAGGTPANNIAKWNGSTWRPVGSGIGNESITTVAAIAINGSDVYVGGVFNKAGGTPANNIAKWNGSTWNALGIGVDRGVSAIAINVSDVYVGGSFGNAGGIAVNRIAKWDGSTWSALGDGVEGIAYSFVNAIAVSENNVYVGGIFTKAGGIAANQIAKWDGLKWSPLGEGINDVGFVDTIAINGSDVYVGGVFSKVGGIPAKHVAKWNGSTWLSLGSGVDSSVLAIAVSGTSVHVGGSFTIAGNKPSNNFAIYHTPANATSVSAASYQSGAAPEQIVSAFGTKLATTTELSQSIPLPTSLAGTIVTVKDSLGMVRPAPLFYVSPSQINYLIPTGTALGTALVKVLSGDGNVSESNVDIDALAPGLFSANANGQGIAAAQILRVNSNNVQTYEPVASYDSSANKFVGLPIDFNNSTDRIFLILYGTGIRANAGLANSIATIGGSILPLLYAEPQGYYVGLDQINIELPRGLIGRGEIAINLTIDRKTTNTVTIMMK